MGILDNVTSGIEHQPQRICVYGSHGVGKTTWAAKFKDALVIATEDGSKNIDVSRVRVKTAMDVTVLAVVYPADDVVVNIKFERNFLADSWVADQAFNEERP